MQQAEPLKPDFNPDLQLASEDIEVVARPPKSLTRETLERLIRKPSAVVGMVILGFLVLVAIFAPVLATHDPLNVLLDVPEEGVVKRMAPCIHLLGCPEAGEELISVNTATEIESSALSSTNSMMLATAGNTLTVWNIESGKQIMALEHDARIAAASWSPNDQLILSVAGNQVYVWDVNRHEISRTLEHPDGVPNFVRYNADGTRFLTANDNTIWLWDTLSWGTTATIELDQPLIEAAWNANGTMVMTASGSTVKLWNAFVGTEVTALEHDQPITSAAFNSASTRLLTTAGNSLHIWNASSYEEEIVITYNQPLTNGSWSENLSRGVRYVMAASEGTSLVWNVSTGELLYELAHGEPVAKIQGSPLATRVFTEGEQTVKVWDTATGDLALTISRDNPITNTTWESTGGALMVSSGSELSIVKTSNYQYLMGVDGNVRDQFSRVIYGTRLSLMVGLLTVTLAVGIGVVAGSVAGFVGGWVDNLIMRIMDVMLAFPPLILAIAVVTVLGPGLVNALLAISIVFIPAYARVARSGVLAVREEDFVTADRALGVNPARILFRRILPNALAPLIVQATLGIGTAILDAAALSFLGLGAQPPTPEWGAMLGAERNQIFTAPHLVFYPGIAIMITVLAFNLLGDGLRDALDPRLDN